MILKELAVVVDTYTDRNGQEKKKWMTIGHVHASKEGREYITLDPVVNLAAIPRREGDSRVFVSMFEPKDKTKTVSKVMPDEDVEDIPF